jgi:glycosyltransferase involved in cell wall biosynthesis
MRVLLITNIPSPYRIPLFNYISNQLLKDGNDFGVWFLSKTEKNRKWRLEYENINFKYRILKGFSYFFPNKDWAFHLNYTIFPDLILYNPDIVIAQYDNISGWLGLLYTQIFNKKFILWSGSHLISSEHKSGLIGSLKKFIIKNSHKYITYGSKATEYLIAFGAQPKNIYTGCNTVDTSYFSTKVQQYRKNPEFNANRKKYPKYMFLYVGQLIERKNVKLILEAFYLLDNNDYGLFIIGSGEQEKYLQEYVNSKNIKNIYFEGYKKKEELIKYYALSNAIILPSYKEVWGLVVNEALACDLYCLVSKNCGVYYDLIEEDKTGNGFDPNNVQQLVYLLKSYNNRTISIDKRKISISRYGDAFLDAIKSV